MSAVRVSAVEYLNARPLVHGLDAHPDLFTVQFDIPAKCAAQLHDRHVDLGLIPSIECQRSADYCIVPDIGVVSTGPVASVALFSDRPATALRSIAVDASSRTAVALLRVLCAEWFDIEPTFVTLRPDLDAMLKRCDAALLIGDKALYQEYELNGLEKTDLGAEWTDMTGLPFVWAVWAGRHDAVTAEQIDALKTARDAGVAALDDIADRFTAGAFAGASPRKPGDESDERQAIAREYLRNNVSYELDDRGIAALKKFYAKAGDLQILSTVRPVKFF
jgi:chorismate dehydratase